MTINGTQYAVREIIDENGFINFYDLKNRPSFLTDENAMIGFGTLGGVLGALLLGQGLSAFGKGLADFFSSLFGGEGGGGGGGGGGEGGGGEPGGDPEPNVFDERILDLIRKHLNPDVVSCVNALDYESMKSVTYANSTQKKLFVNWNDKIFGNPFAKPCNANHVGLLRSLMMSTSAKLYTCPASVFSVDDITQITSMGPTDLEDPFIDFGTRAVSLTSIPTSFTAPNSAKIGTIEGYDFEANRPGVVLRFPTAAQRAAYDLEQRLALRNVLQYRRREATKNACVLIVRNTETDAAPFANNIAVIDYKGQYLQDIRPSQILTTEALNERSLHDGTVRLNRDDLFAPESTATEDMAYRNRLGEAFDGIARNRVNEILDDRSSQVPLRAPLRLSPINEAGDFVGSEAPFAVRRAAFNERLAAGRVIRNYVRNGTLTPTRPPPPPPMPIEEALGLIQDGNFIAMF